MQYLESTGRISSYVNGKSKNVGWKGVYDGDKAKIHIADNHDEYYMILNNNDLKNLVNNTNSNKGHSKTLDERLNDDFRMTTTKKRTKKTTTKKKAPKKTTTKKTTTKKTTTKKKATRKTTRKATRK